MNAGMWNWTKGYSSQKQTSPS